MKTMEAWIGAGEAARTLGVTRATLYAYVSRGVIRSEAHGGSSRERRYSREDVEALRRRTEERRDPQKAASRALQWGVPVLESAITLIANGRVYYRGVDAAVLARTRSVAEVASLVWTGDPEGSLLTPPADSPASTAAATGIGTRAGGRGAMPFVARAQAALAQAAGRDPMAFDARPLAVAQTGWRILTLLARVAAGTDNRADTIDVMLARAWGQAPAREMARARRREAEAGRDAGRQRAREPAHAAAIRAAIILSADHELNVSSFTARCVASAGSSPYDVVIAGLAAVEGTKHGGISLRIESRLPALRRTRDVRAALAEQLRRGEAIEGFGHPLYRDGDPRAAALMQVLRERYPRSPELALGEAVARAAVSLLHERPTIDFALAILARVLRLPEGSALTLFALGRTIGWIGHAIEQYARPGVIRPRARYVGPPPRHE